MTPEVFDQSPESTVPFELRHVRAYGSKALLQVRRWPLCIFADYPVQKFQRGFGKSLVELYFVEPMNDSVGIVHSLQPPVNLAKRCREFVPCCDTQASEAFRDRCGGNLPSLGPDIRQVRFYSIPPVLHRSEQPQ